jgi:coenzyme PQQ precursor peptide PqqA
MRIAYRNRGHRRLELNVGLSFLAMKGISPCLIYKQVRMRLDACASFLAQQRAFVEEHMAWTTPTLVEICIGLEINGYLPAEF